jgi:CubicO group peptidase (beta-lactamase class C family)
MNFNIKTILLGGLVFYVTMFIISMGLGPFIHEGVLDPLYMQTNSFWRPELQQDPPDMAALMPRWIATGLLTSFIFVGIYDNIRSAFSGSGIIKGLKFGLMMGVIYASIGAGWSGVFNLPETIFFWWGVEGLIVYAAGGAALGWYVGKWGTD